jgi:parvulin-like peptidyl-prolyl isomerase
MTMVPATMDSLAALGGTTIALLKRHGLLEPLVRAEIVDQAVATTAVSAEEEAGAIKQLRQQQGLNEEGAFAAFLTKQALSQEELAWKLTLPLRIQRHSQEHFGHKAEAHFLDRKNQLDRVVYSLLRVRDGFLARELYLRISEGEANFADLAAEFSLGKEKDTKGIVGPVPLTQAHPILAEVLRTSQSGELHQPIRIDEWFLVVRLESFTPASLDPATEGQMARELFEQSLKSETF